MGKDKDKEYEKSKVWICKLGIILESEVNEKDAIQHFKALNNDDYEINFVEVIEIKKGSIEFKEKVIAN